MIERSQILALFLITWGLIMLVGVAINRKLIAIEHEVGTVVHQLDGNMAQNTDDN